MYGLRGKDRDIDGAVTVSYENHDGKENELLKSYCNINTFIINDTLTKRGIPNVKFHN